ncbi:MAG TPA: nucleotidyltransferase family protein [Gemmatimonadales bacterium]
MTGQASDLLLETLRLRPGSSGPDLRCAWRAARTESLAALVAFEGCSLWLYRRLTELGALAGVEPAFAAWLARSARRIAARNLLVDAQRDAVVAILNELECPHVLLKGAGRRLVTHLYPYADARATGDVDVLLPVDRAQEAWDRLRAAGFAAPPHVRPTHAMHHHLTPLANERPVCVEIHTSTARGLPAREAWARMTIDALPVQHERRTTRVASATELLWHAVAHAFAAPPATAFRLRFLLDAAVVWTGGEALDWTRIERRLDGGELPTPRLARRWLGAAAWLAGRAAPARVIGTEPPFALHHLLRWQLDVCRALAWGPGSWSRAPVSRLRRLLIEEATRASVGVPIAAAPVARWPAAGLARMCFRTWSLMD